MEELWKTQYPLKEHTDPSTYKSYEELQKRLDVVLGNTPSPAMSAPSSVDSSEVPFDGGTPMETSSSYREEEVSDDENLDYFKKLAEA